VLWRSTLPDVRAIVAALLIGCAEHEDGVPTAADAEAGADAVAVDTAMPDSGATDTADTIVDTGTDLPVIEPGISTTATPIFSPAPGTYDGCGPLIVTIVCTTAGATIHYTTDGTDPTTSSPIYTAPIEVMGTITLKAFARASDHKDSVIVTGFYTTALPTAKPVAPTFNPPGGSFTMPPRVSLSTPTAGATICYTLDGVAPECECKTGLCRAGTTYADPFVVTPTASGTKVNAIACVKGPSSDVVSATYTSASP
jgi:hypothetical protein